MKSAFRILALATIFLSLASNTEGLANKGSEMVLRITIQESGGVLLGGIAVKPSELIAALDDAKENNATVWYYRENPATEPPQSATQVIQMIIDRKLSISLSTKPDFSDYVDENGNVQPRK